MKPRRRFLQPRSRWQSSNLSPYDEDLRIPAHIRHQERLEEQRMLSALDAEYAELGISEYLDLDTERIDGDPLPEEDGLSSPYVYVDRPTDDMALDIPDAEKKTVSGSDDSDVRKAQLSPSPPQDGPPPMSPRPSLGREDLDPDHPGHESESAAQGDDEESAAISSSGTLRLPSPSRRPDESRPSSLSQANRLLPKTHFQVELYKICSMLRKLVLINTKVFAVVDPHDFLEALSWRHLEAEERNKLSIIRRLRHLSAVRFLIPFCWDQRILLGLIDKEDEMIDLYNPDPKWKGAAVTASGRDLPVALLESFADGVWPERHVLGWRGSPKVYQTATAREFPDPRLMEEYDGDRSSEIKHVLPIFLQALIIVSQVWLDEPFRKFDPLLLRRLLASFESDHTTPVLEDLRQRSRLHMRLSIHGPVKRAEAEGRGNIWEMRTTKESPEGVIAAKWRARVNIRFFLEIAELSCSNYVEQHSQLSQIVEALRTSMLKATSSFARECWEEVVVYANDPTRPSPGEWEQSRSLHRGRTCGLADLEARLERMASELRDWREQCHSFLWRA